VRRHGFTLAALAIVLLAAWLRFWALDLGLPNRLARPDEGVVLAQTRAPASGRSVEWAIYPSGYVYLTWAWGALGLEAAERLGVFPRSDYLSVLDTNPERLILVGRVLSALAGTIAVPLLIGVMRGAFGAPAALAGGAILATNFLHARDSHGLKPDTLLALAVLVALWGMVPLARRATAARAAGVGVAIGLATAIKYTGVLLAAPAWLAAVLGSAQRGWRRLVPWPAVVVGLVAVVVFFATAPALLFDPKSRASFSIILTFLPGGLSGAKMPSGNFFAGFAYHALFSLRYGAGLLPALLLPLAVAAGLANRHPLARLTAVFVVVYYCVVSTSSVTLARWITPLMPPLALLEGALLAAAARRVVGRAAPLALAALVAVLVAEPLASAVQHDRIAARTDTRVEATAWMAEHLPPGAVVAVVGTWVWGYGVPRMPPGIRQSGRPIDPEDPRAHGATHVLTHDHVLAFSHVDEEKMAALAPQLELLATFDPFVEGRRDAIFEPSDAYYIPFHGFGSVVRPGPLIRIYALRGVQP
jgi:hypothetical protein